jgi:hypothetical protein
MKTMRRFITAALVASIASPAFAQTTAPIAAAAEQALAAQLPQTTTPPSSPTPGRPSGKKLVYTGAAVFAGGMTAALYGFIRAGNGEFATFGEATSRNKPLGAAGLATAFAGGTMMFLGSRAGRYAPSQVTINRTEVAVGRTVTW